MTPRLSSKELKEIQRVIDDEGFLATFVHVSPFPKVEDPQFQALRKAFLDAANAFANYLNVEL